jgi:hypothetical protein
MEEVELLLVSLIEKIDLNSKEAKKLIEEQSRAINELKNKGGDIQAVEELKRLIVRQTSEIEELKNKNNEIDYSKLPNPTTQRPSIYLTIFGGNNGQISNKWIIVAICFISFSYFGFMYIPSYLNEANRQEKEYLMTRTFVDHLTFLQFKKFGNTEKIEQFIKEIYDSDSTFLDDHNKLREEYNREQKRIQLENEKNELDKQLKELK